MSSTTLAPDRDTILTTLYVIVADLYEQHLAGQRPTGGRPPVVSDAEVLTLMVLAQWRPDRSERAFLRYVARHWRAYFPQQVSQSAFNRRARHLWGVLSALGPLIAQAARQALGLPHPRREVIDGVPVPLVRRCRSRRRPLGLAAGLGRGGSDKSWYYGVKLLLSVAPDAFIQGAVAGPANTEERWLLEALLHWRWDPTVPAPTADDLAPVLGPAHRHQGQRQGPTGPLGPRWAAGVPAVGPLWGDLNYRGDDWQAHWHADLSQPVGTKADLADPAQRRAFNAARQVVERVNGRLEALFGLWYPRARSLRGLWARLGAKLAAHNLLLWFNRLTGSAPEALWSPLDA